MEASRSVRQPGFSLVELLVVIAVIVILVALLIPAIGMARGQARSKQCASNQVQIFLAWTRANSRDSRQPVRGPQWTTRVATYIEGGEGVFFCPDDTIKNQASSYAFNAHAWRFGGKDHGRIALLDYKQTEIKVVGQSLDQLNDSWPVQQAPRHFQYENVTFFDSHGEPYEPRKIDPRFCDYYVRYWRPVADSNVALAGCVNSGDPLPTSTFPTSGGSTGSTAGSAGTTATGSKTASGTTTSTATTGPSSTSTSTTTSTTTTTTTGGSTTTSTATTGSTTSSTPCNLPGVGSVSGQLLALYKFDEAAAPGIDSGNLGNDAGLLDPNKHTIVDDPEPDLTKSRCKVMLFKRDSEVGYTGQPFRVSNPITSMANEFTVAFWWKGTDTSSFFTFMGTGSGGAWNSRFVYYGGGTTMHVNSGNSNALNMPSPGFTTNEWHHYAFALSIPLQTMYAWRDGVQTSQGNGSSPASAVQLSKVFINALEFNGSLMVNGGAVGYFDNYRVYNRVLNTAEVLAIYGEEKRP